MNRHQLKLPVYAFYPIHAQPPKLNWWQTLILDLHYKEPWLNFRDLVDIVVDNLLFVERHYYLSVFDWNQLMNNQISVANIHETKHFEYCSIRAIDENIVRNQVHVMNVLWSTNKTYSWEISLIKPTVIAPNATGSVLFGITFNRSAHASLT